MLAKTKHKKQPQTFSTTDQTWERQGNQVKSQVTERVNCEIELTAFAFSVQTKCDPFSEPSTQLITEL